MTVGEMRARTSPRFLKDYMPVPAWHLIGVDLMAHHFTYAWYYGRVHLIFNKLNRLMTPNSSY